jgi:hypothetical protein
MRSALRTRPPSQRERAAARLASPIRGVLAASQIRAATPVEDAVEDAVVAAFREQDDDALLSCLVRVLRDFASSAEGGVEPEAWASPPLAELRELAVDKLRARLERPERAGDDWSLALPPGCGCDLCGVLADFLADADRRRFEWAIAKQHRQHVHQRIDVDGIPVRHHTRRSGRPYTLVLEKKEELFEAEANQRRSWRAELGRLTRS